jgi:hypothetical protein
MEITCVTVDCHDPGRVATFWNDALGWGGAAVAPDGSGAVCRPAGGGGGSRDPEGNELCLSGGVFP